MSFTAWNPGKKKLEEFQLFHLTPGLPCYFLQSNLPPERKTWSRVVLVQRALFAGNCCSLLTGQCHFPCKQDKVQPIGEKELPSIIVFCWENSTHWIFPTFVPSTDTSASTKVAALVQIQQAWPAMWTENVSELEAFNFAAPPCTHQRPGWEGVQPEVRGPWLRACGRFLLKSSEIHPPWIAGAKQQSRKKPADRMREKRGKVSQKWKWWGTGMNWGKEMGENLSKPWRWTQIYNACLSLSPQYSHSRASRNKGLSGRDGSQRMWHPTGHRPSFNVGCTPRLLLSTSATSFWFSLWWFWLPTEGGLHLQADIWEFLQPDPCSSSPFWSSTCPGCEVLPNAGFQDTQVRYFSWKKAFSPFFLRFSSSSWEDFLLLFPSPGKLRHLLFCQGAKQELLRFYWTLYPALNNLSWIRLLSGLSCSLCLGKCLGKYNTA